MARFSPPSAANPNAVAKTTPQLGRAFYFAWQGLRYAWLSEKNFRLEVLIGLAALALGAYLGVDLVPIILCCVLVLTLELLNTAIEASIDLLAPGYHPLAKTAKDVAAAAVLLASVGAALVGLLLLGPPLWQRVVG